MVVLTADILTTIAFVTILAGVILRIVSAFLQKQGTEPVTFDPKYIGAGIAAIITAISIAYLLVQNVTIPDQPVAIIILIVGWFLQGWGATDVISKYGIDWRESK